MRAAAGHLMASVSPRGTMEAQSGGSWSRGRDADATTGGVAGAVACAVGGMGSAWSTGVDHQGSWGVKTRFEKGRGNKYALEISA